MLGKPKYAGPERRQRYRVTNEVKILIKVGNMFSQVGSVKNLTRNGIFFEAFGDYQPGMGMEVVFPYDPIKALDGTAHACRSRAG